ncbi:MAG: hypothetical protein Q7S03_04255 [bacterium]|nr:hypothetical protein [bacterium]
MAPERQDLSKLSFVEAQRLEEMQKLILDDESLKALILDPDKSLEDQPESTQKALNYLFRLAQAFAKGSQFHVETPSLPLLGTKIANPDILKSIKEEDKNNLTLHVDQDGTSVLEEEYTRRELEESGQVLILFHRRMHKTFRIQQSADGTYCIELSKFYSPSKHIHIFHLSKRKKLRVFAGEPFYSNEVIDYGTRIIKAHDINLLLRICQSGLSPRVANPLASPTQK